MEAAHHSWASILARTSSQEARWIGGVAIEATVELSFLSIRERQAIGVSTDAIADCLDQLEPLRDAEPLNLVRRKHHWPQRFLPDTASAMASAETFSRHSRTIWSQGMSFAS
jgi:hypothetical protein